MYKINAKAILYQILRREVICRQRMHIISTYEKYDELKKRRSLTLLHRYPRYTSDLLDLRSEIKIESLSNYQVDGLLQQAMDELDTKMILEVLKRGKPTRYSLEKLLFNFMKEKDSEIMNAVKEYQDYQPWMEPYFAGYIWYNGNLKDATKLFRKLFFQNDRNIVIKVLKDITLDTVGKQSEASLVILTQLAEYFSCIFDDHRQLFVIWHASFQSEWFSDQQHARELFNKSIQLRYFIQQNLPNLCQMFLAKDNFDACQRILQLFLELNDRDSIQSILTMMFDHSYLKRDMRRCSEILKFSNRLDVPIGKSLGFRIANLLMDKDEKKTIQPPKFKFKF